MSESKVKMEMANGVLKAPFIVARRTGQETQIVFHPDADDIYLGITSIGRGTSQLEDREGRHCQPRCAEALVSAWVAGGGP